MALIIAALLLIGFTVNVALGAISDSAPLGNVSEMLLLFSSAIAFTAGILQREAAAKSASKNQK